MEKASKTNTYRTVFFLVNRIWYLRGRAIAYQRSIAIDITTATEKLASAQTKKLRWTNRQKSSPFNPDGIGISLFPITNVGDKIRKTPAKQKIV